jgi:isoquinoline 1-oxidoreductase alpha subunit
MITLTINGTKHQLDVPPDMPLLWAIRDVVGLTGTKFGCGQALCGACTVHVNGNAVRSCQYPVAAAVGQHITTIEGISHGEKLHPVQEAWIAENVPQCGYCQSGQIMNAAALLAHTPKPTDQQITDAMTGNICRCGMYPRIRRAIKRAAGVA